MAETVSAAANRNGAPQTMTEASPLVSIVVPTYNVGPALLRAAIASALDQTFANLEVIVVNDASTDDTMTAAGEFTDPRLQIINLPENRGVSSARNIGVEIARGEWIGFIDADDRMAPSMIERLLEIADKSGADIAACSFLRLQPGELFPSSSEPEAEIKIAKPDDAIAEVLYQTGSLNNSPCGKLYRRELCVAQPWMPGRYEDLRTFYRLFLLARRIAWTAEPLYVYTVNPHSYLGRFTPRRAVVLDVVEEMVEFMEKEHPRLVAPARDRALSAAFNILKLLRANSMREPEIEARCRRIIRRYRSRSLFNPRVRFKNKAAIIATYLGALQIF